MLDVGDCPDLGASLGKPPLHMLWFATDSRFDGIAIDVELHANA